MKTIIPLEQEQPAILKGRVEDFNNRPEHANTPTSVEVLQLFVAGLVHFTDTDHKTFIPPAEQQTKAKAIFAQMERDLAAITPKDGLYKDVCVINRAGRELKKSCIAWQGRLDYEDVPQNLEGLQLVINGKFWLTDNSTMKFDSPELQREKAKFIFEAAKDVILPEPQNDDERAARMLWNFYESPWAKWMDSIQKKSA